MANMKCIAKWSMPKIISEKLGWEQNGPLQNHSLLRKQEKHCKVIEGISSWNSWQQCEN